MDCSNLGYKSSTSSDESNILYFDGLPISLYRFESDEPRHRENPSKANKTFATVKTSYPNPIYRGKRGYVVDRKDDGSVCLHLEKPYVGCRHFHGFPPTVYEDVWFKSDEVGNFKSYNAIGGRI